MTYAYENLFNDVDNIEPTEHITGTASASNIFMPKPFVFANMLSSGTTKVYLPGQTYTPFIDGMPLTGFNLYMCVHMCEQFMNYPTIQHGIRCIPDDAACPFGGRCHGAHLMFRGKPIKNGIDLNYQIVSGLVKPQKTK